MRDSIRRFGVVAATLLLTSCGGVLSPKPEAPAPIIDMHMHVGPGIRNSTFYSVAPGASADEARRDATLAEMDRLGVVFGMLVGPAASAQALRLKAPQRFLAGVSFPCTDGLDANLFECFDNGADFPDLTWLRGEVTQGRIGVIGELYNVYAGVSPLDPRMQPYFDLAAELDTIVAVHADRGPPPPGRTPGCCANFNGDYGSPALFSAVLERHPKLRLYLMHVFRPEFVEQAIVLMRQYPNVYMDTSPMSQIPPSLAHAALKRVTEAGFGDRILFGSDYLGKVQTCMEVIDSAEFLTPQQKRAILYDNAAKFLRLPSDKR